MTVILIVIGTLGTISNNAKAWYGRLSLRHFFGSAQLLAILGTARILRKVLCFYAAGRNIHCWNIRNVNLKFHFFPEMRLYFLMFITAFCFLFLRELRWPKYKNNNDDNDDH